MNILITGASGFVGRALIEHLKRGGHKVAPISRQTQSSDLNIGSCECLIHLAARAHVVRETVQHPYLAFKEANVDYSMRMAQFALQMQIPRFIFLSTIGVNGNTSQQPFKESDTPQPHNDYAQTKWEAELELKEFFKGSDTALTIIRPPLIYGPNPKANFKALLSLCRYPLPLPFGAINNKRSFISIYNLCQFIELCCTHPAAANQTFLISDDHDVSITELVTAIRKALARSTCLVPVPISLLRILFTMIGKHGLNEQLLANLEIDTNKAKELLNWKPLISFDEGIKRAVEIDVA